MSDIGGSPLIKATLMEPLYGVWTVDVEVDESETDYTGAQTINIENVIFEGTVVDGGIFQGKWIGRLAGGANGLGTIVEAKHYRGTSIRGLVDDLNNKTNEVLDLDNSDSAVVNREVPVWQRERGRAGAALAHIVDDIGSTASILRSGLLRLGSPATPDTVETTPDQLLLTLPERRMSTFGVQTPQFKPGDVHELGTASYVITNMDPKGIRQQVWFA